MKVARAALISILVSSPAVASEIHVPGDYATIQEAIVAAMDGDQVTVAPGLYFENIDFLGKAITVAASGGPSVTVINAQGSGSVVSFQNGEGRDSVLSGFRITRGVGTDDGTGATFGGGIYCVGASPTVTGNEITANTATADTEQGAGGGIYLSASAALIRTNLVEDNLATLRGGGIAIVDGSTALLRNNRVLANRAVHYPDSAGGGISSQQSSPEIDRNIIHLNRAIAGGGLSGEGGPMSVTSNSFYKNEANHAGGGAAHCTGEATFLYNRFSFNIAWSTTGGAALQFVDADVWVAGCHFVRNLVTAHGPGPATCVSAESTEIVLTNNTMVANDGTSSVWLRTFSNGVITNSILYDNVLYGGPEIQVSPSATALVTYSDVEGGYAGEGNFDVKPGLSPKGLMHLRADSPCLDAGINTAPGLPDNDFDGDPRIVRVTVDVGADEAAGCLIQFESFGTGAAGSGGFVPVLRATDAFCDDGAELEIRQGLGSAVGSLWAGLGHTFSNPGYGGNFYLDFSQSWVRIPIALSGVGPGAGQLDLPTGDLTALQGLTLHLQVSLADPATPWGASFSNGLQMDILPGE